MAGLGFKIAVVPFHLWAPDTYGRRAGFHGSGVCGVGVEGMASFALLIMLAMNWWLGPKRQSRQRWATATGVDLRRLLPGLAFAGHHTIDCCSGFNGGGQPGGAGACRARNRACGRLLKLTRLSLTPATFCWVSLRIQFFQAPAPRSASTWRVHSCHPAHDQERALLCADLRPHHDWRIWRGRRCGAGHGQRKAGLLPGFAQAQSAAGRGAA